MKQRWVLQGRTSSDSKWIDLIQYRRRRDARVNKVNHRAKKIGMKAEYRVILKEDPS